jgi:hypothetical protein
MNAINMSYALKGQKFVVDKVLIIIFFVKTNIYFENYHRSNVLNVVLANK